MIRTLETTIAMDSSSFGEGQAIPRKFSMEGENLSPALSWGNVPDDAKELILMVEDPDGLAGTISHWLVYNIPPDLKGLPEGIDPVGEPKGAGGIRQGKNSMGKLGYFGPYPGPGTGPHHYYFRIFAVDCRLNLPPGADKEDVQKAMFQHVIGEGNVMGTYERR